MKPIIRSHTRSQPISTIKSQSRYISPLQLGYRSNVIHTTPRVHEDEYTKSTITSDSLEFQDEIQIDTRQGNKVELFKSLQAYVDIQLSEFHLDNILKDEIKYHAD